MNMLGVPKYTVNSDALPPVLEDAEVPGGGTKQGPQGSERGCSTSIADGATAGEPPAA
jgi:hypothetical protein